MRRRLANEYDKLLGIEVGTIRVTLIDLYILIAISAAFISLSLLWIYFYRIPRSRRHIYKNDERVIPTDDLQI